MHELTLCYQTHELIVEQAKAQGARCITAVWLEVGALSCVEIEAMTFCFDLVCKDSIAEGCKIYINQEVASAWCEACQKKVPINNAFIPLCSECSNPLKHVDANDSLWVKKIQVE